jgi:hypothetical protein
VLSEQILAKNSFPDYEAYPVVFLFRHALELYLKNIIYKAVPLSAFRGLEDIDARLFNHHELGELSKLAASALRKLFPNDDALEQVVQTTLTISTEFSEIDYTSFSYRYPVDKQGKPSTKHHQVCNLGAMYASLSRLMEDLDTIDFGLGIAIDDAQEIYEMLEALP